MNDRLNTLDWISLVLVIVGAINWGLVGFFNFNLIGAVFGASTAIVRVIFALVGLAGLYAIASVVKMGGGESYSTHPRGAM